MTAASISANAAAVTVSVRAADAGQKVMPKGSDPKPGFSDLLAKLAAVGGKGAGPSPSSQPAFSDLLKKVAAANEEAASGPANPQPDVADLLAKMATVWEKTASTPPMQAAAAAVQGVSAQSSDGNGNEPSLMASMAVETSSKADVKEPTADIKDQPPAADPPAVAPPVPQAGSIVMAASAPGVLLPPAVSPAPAAGTVPAAPGDGGADQTHGAERNAAAVPPLPNAADASAKVGPDAMPPPGFAAAAAAQRITVLARETHIAPAQLLQPVQGALDRVPAKVMSQPASALEQHREADGEIGEVEPASKPATGPAGARPTGSLQGSSAWNVKSGSDEDAGANEDRASSHPGAAADSAVTSVAKDGVRVSGAAPLPTQQVAGRIVAAALATQQDGGSIDASSVPTVSSPIIKVLHLELQPADLGTITIRMSLKQDGLDIRLEASRHDTAVMLQRDQEGLAKLLTSAGYHLDGMTVAVSAAHGSQTPDGSASAFLPTSLPDQGSSSQPDARSSGGRQSASSDSRTFRGNQNDDNDTSGAGRGAGSDVYV
jgi:Flagellar hook-length control protein FliK